MQWNENEWIFIYFYKCVEINIDRESRNIDFESNST